MANTNQPVRDYVFSIRTTKQTNEDILALAGVLSATLGRRVGKAEAIEIAVSRMLKATKSQLANAYAYERE